MLDLIKNAAKTALTFLQNGVSPPNTSEEQRNDMEKMNHLTSKKFFIVCVSVCILAFFYFSSVLILFVIPTVPEIITGYITIFSKSLEILAIIIATYLSVQATIDFKYGSNTNVTSNSNSISEKSEIRTITEVIDTKVIKYFEDKYKNDDSYRPIIEIEQTEAQWR